jgi:hypothetical protein
VLEEIDFGQTWVHVGFQSERPSKLVFAHTPVDLIQDSRDLPVPRSAL